MKTSDTRALALTYYALHVFQDGIKAAEWMAAANQELGSSAIQLAMRDDAGLRVAMRALDEYTLNNPSLRRTASN